MPITKMKAPYTTTTKDPDATMSDINRLLKKYGISEIQWTTFWESNIVELRFALTQPDGKRVGVKLAPPSFKAKRRTWNDKKGHYETILAPNWSQSLRLLYWFLKSKLEAVSYGLVDFDEEFLGNLIVRLPSGKESTMIESIRARLDIPELDGEVVVEDKQ